jgi:hypothetical protein
VCNTNSIRYLVSADKGSSGNALTDFFFVDVGIKQNQFNVGQQLLSTGIVLLEVSAAQPLPDFINCNNC